MRGSLTKRLGKASILKKSRATRRQEINTGLTAQELVEILRGQLMMLKNSSRHLRGQSQNLLESIHTL